MCKMKHIMESVSIRVENIIRERIADEYTIPLQITLSAFSLRDFDLEIPRESFLIREFVVERW